MPQKLQRKHWIIQVAPVSSCELAFQKIPKEFKRFEIIPKESKRFWKIPKYSQRFWKIPKDSKRNQKILKYSKRFPKILKDSERITKDSEKALITQLVHKYLFSLSLLKAKLLMGVGCPRIKELEAIGAWRKWIEDSFCAMHEVNILCGTCAYKWSLTLLCEKVQ